MNRTEGANLEDQSSDNPIPWWEKKSDPWWAVKNKLSSFFEQTKREKQDQKLIKKLIPVLTQHFSKAQILTIVQLFSHESSRQSTIKSITDACEHLHGPHDQTTPGLCISSTASDSPKTHVTSQSEISPSNESFFDKLKKKLASHTSAPRPSNVYQSVDYPKNSTKHQEFDQLLEETLHDLDVLEQISTAHNSALTRGSKSLTAKQSLESETFLKIADSTSINETVKPDKNADIKVRNFKDKELSKDQTAPDEKLETKKRSKRKKCGGMLELGDSSKNTQQIENSIHDKQLSETKKVPESNQLDQASFASRGWYLTAPLVKRLKKRKHEQRISGVPAAHENAKQTEYSNTENLSAASNHLENGSQSNLVPTQATQTQKSEKKKRSKKMNSIALFKTETKQKVSITDRNLMHRRKSRKNVLALDSALVISKQNDSQKKRQKKKKNKVKDPSDPIFMKYPNESPPTILLRALENFKMKLEWKTEEMEGAHISSVYFNDVCLVQALGHSAKKAKREACATALQELQKYYYTIIIMENSNEVSIHRTDSENFSRESDLNHNNIGFKMMESMGWSGGGLGKSSQGITEPVTLEPQYSRAGIGIEKKLDKKDFKKKCSAVMRNHLENDPLADLIFYSFTSEEIALIKPLASKLGFKILESRSNNDRIDLKLYQEKSAREIVDALLKLNGTSGKYKLIEPCINPYPSMEPESEFSRPETLYSPFGTSIDSEQDIQVNSCYKEPSLYSYQDEFLLYASSYYPAHS